MDGLSAAASVIAVIQISAQVFDLCRTYYLIVKDARKDIQRLQNEISSLEDILVNVVDLANAPQSTSLQTLNLLKRDDGPLNQCQLELKALLTKLDPGETMSKVKLTLRSLKWPLQSKEIDKVLLAIGRYKDSFVLALSTDQASLALAISRDVSEIKNQLDSQKSDENREAIIRWLSTTDPSVNFHASRRKCQPETGIWLINRADFKNWKVSPNSFLWLYGIPGCGKTILSSTIIEHLQQSYNKLPKHAVAYFYFDFNARAKQEVSACLSSIVAQLCTHIGTLPLHIKQSYERSSYGKLQPSLDELTGILFEIVESLNQAFIVIDALDECPKGGGRDLLLAVISDLKSRSLDNLHALVTSRREPDIEEYLTPLLTGPPIFLQGSEMNGDIQSHISSVLATDPKLKRWSNEIKQEIKDTLSKGANGMFRWVVCQLDALKRCLKASLIRKALQNLPTTLDDTYSRLFLEIDDAYRQEAKAALLWLAFSECPLLLCELAEAIVINPRSDPPFDTGERFPDPQSVLQILSSLVSVSSNNAAEGSMAKVTLAHFSVKEYLVSDRIQESSAHYFAISKPAAHYFIAECCLLYILHYANEATRTSSLTDVAAFPLLTYTSDWWYIHINLLPLEQQKNLNPIIFKLLLSEVALSSWLDVCALRFSVLDPLEYGMTATSRIFYASSASPCFYASSMGLLQVVKEFLEAGWDPNWQGHQLSLHSAIIRGHREVVNELLLHGTNVNARDHQGYSPLHHAVEEGNIAIVQLLLFFKAEASPKDKRGSTPLHLAAFYSHEQIAKFLVDQGAEVEVSTIDDLRTPLHWAAWNESRPLLELLLKHGADINAKNDKGETALHYAARDNQTILQDLLDNGADVDIETCRGDTPLFWAVKGGELESVEKLVKAGAKITVPLLLSTKDGLHGSFHYLLDVGMSNEETASLSLLALQERARMGYELCDECQRILSGTMDLELPVQGVLPIREVEGAHGLQGSEIVKHSLV